MKNKKVILSVINDIETDQRVHRIAQTLHLQGYEVLVVGRCLAASRAFQRDYKTYRMLLKFNHGKLFYIEFMCRLFWFLLHNKADILTANDLDTLLPNYLVSKIKGSRLIYDSHEYFTQVPELVNRPVTRKIWEILEGFLFPKLKTVYTVNEAIAQIYQQKYNVNVQVVHNYPFLSEIDVNHSVPKEKILIYQGALNLGRGIELMIEVVKHLPGYQLWIIGGGDIQQQLQQKVNNEKLDKIVKLWNRLPFEQLREITMQAQWGFSLEEDLGLNYRYATPNKIYDYINALVPCIVSDLPLMSQIVKKWNIGHIAAQRQPQTIAGMILNTHTEEYNNMVENLKNARTELNWQNESKKIIQIYH